MITEKDKICFLGDSITFGAGTTRRYFDIISDLTGAETRGYGIDGAQSDMLFDEIKSLEADAGDDFDILCVLIGTNDFNGGVPLGEFFTEKTETVVVSTNSAGAPNAYAIRKKREFVFDGETFCGRLNKFFAYVTERYADKRLIVLTPLHRAYAYFGLANVQQNELYANSIGEYFEKYVETVRRAADIWAVELIDLYRESGLFPLADKNAELYFHDGETDRLHPNKNGHERIARAILRRL